MGADDYVEAVICCVVEQVGGVATVIVARELVEALLHGPQTGESDRWLA